MDDILLHCLRHPVAMARLTPARWEMLIRQARAAGLLGRLLVLLERNELLARVPAAPRRHLESAQVLGESQVRAVRWEVACIREALHELPGPFILLKGAAYVMAGLPVAVGRTFGDVDILVARHDLERAEALLQRHGWEGACHDAYDQHYYRQWMHELPPLRHGRRGTVIDVHHGLLPLTGRLRPDAGRLRAAARAVPGEEGLWTLAPVDLVLHAACHLFHEGEFSRGLRNLMDLDGLLRHFASDPGFWDALPARALELELERPLFYGLRYAQRLLDTPVPANVCEASGGPPSWLQPFMDSLFLRALRPAHDSAADVLTPAALGLLNLRAHGLRMPLPLLLRHLGRKAWRRLRDEPDGALVRQDG